MHGSGDAIYVSRLQFERKVSKLSSTYARKKILLFITESDFGGDIPENQASSDVTLMQRKLTIG